MHAFSWGLLRGASGPECVQFYLIDALIIRVDTYDGRRHAPFLLIEADADHARARMLKSTADHEANGYVFDGEVYAAEVPDHQTEALLGWLRNEPTGFSSDALLVALAPHWEPLS